MQELKMDSVLRRECGHSAARNCLSDRGNDNPASMARCRTLAGIPLDQTGIQKMDQCVLLFCAVALPQVQSWPQSASCAPH